MQKPHSTYIVLLRGINVGGHRKIPMATLRSLCARIGYKDVRTYIQSGNILLTTNSDAEEVERKVEQAVEEQFGFSVPAIARETRAWQGYLKSNPFSKASLSEPSRVMLVLAKATPKSDALKNLRSRAANNERLAQTGDALWIHCPEGAATSKISATLLDRFVGATVTVRNWRTVQKLGQIAEPLTISSQ